MDAWFATLLGRVVGADDCFYRQAIINNVGFGPYIQYSLVNCCPETRYLRYAVLGALPTRAEVPGAPPTVDMSTAPALITYALDDGVTTLSPACTSTRTKPSGGCSSPEACSGVWTVELPPGELLNVGGSLVLPQAATDGFVPTRLSIFMPRATADPNAAPTMPAAVALCPDDARFGCLDCADFVKPDPISVDLTTIPGGVEAATRMFFSTP